MPQFSDHIDQAKHNLRFLENVNKHGPSFLDWEVTTCFYITVHLVNAHLSLHDMQYRKHVDVKAALNPKSQQSVANGTAMDETEYLAYMKLQSLSRRSRYLVNEKDDNLESKNAFKTYDVHFARALRHLNTLLDYFKKSHKQDLGKITISCPEIKSGELSFVEIQ